MLINNKTMSYNNASKKKKKKHQLNSKPQSSPNSEVYRQTKQTLHLFKRLINLKWLQSYATSQLKTAH